MNRRQLALELFLRLPPKRLEALIDESGNDETKIMADQCWDAAFDILDALDEREAQDASELRKAVRDIDGKWIPAAHRGIPEGVDPDA